MDLIEGIRGDSWIINLEFVDDNGDLMDLSSYSASWALKKYPTETTTDYIAGPNTLTTSNLGTVTGTILPSVTKDIPAGKYYEEIKIQNADSTIVKSYQRYRNVKGRVIIPGTS